MRTPRDRSRAGLIASRLLFTVGLGITCACGPNALEPIVTLAGASVADASTDGALPDTVSLPCALSTSTNRRGSDAAILTRPLNDLAPTVIRDRNGMYRMWWCAGETPPRILYAEADGLDGPWHAHASTDPDTFDEALAGSGVHGDFDGAGVCDPAVVRTADKYYLYYSAHSFVAEEWWTVGVASSPDGATWTRLGQAARPANPDRYGTFGAGGPSVIARGGTFYLFYTDTTGFEGLDGGGSMFALRSPDPVFRSNVEEWAGTAWAPRDPTNIQARAVLKHWGADWQYVPEFDGYLGVVEPNPGETMVFAFDQAFQPVASDAITLPTQWAHPTPALVSSPEHYALAGPDCATVPIDVISTVKRGEGWDFAHHGADVPLSCACVR